MTLCSTQGLLIGSPLMNYTCSFHDSFNFNYIDSQYVLLIPLGEVFMKLGLSKIRTSQVMYILKNIQTRYSFSQFNHIRLVMPIVACLPV